jgi:hypothetical protein
VEPGEAFPAPWSSLASLLDGSLPRETGRWSQAAAFPRPPRPVRRGGWLIANLELESRLTYRKLSPLKISNRKFLAIFYLASHSRLACPDESQRRRRVAQFLIANARLEFPANHTKQSTATKSNRERIAIFHLAFRSLATRHSSLITRHYESLVRGTRIKSYQSRVTAFARCSTRRKSAFLVFRRCAMLQSRGQAETRREEGTEEK